LPSDLGGGPQLELPFGDGTAFVAKLDSAGGYLWHYAFADPTGNALTEEAPVRLVPNGRGGATVFVRPRNGAAVIGDLVLEGDGIQIVSLSADGDATLEGLIPASTGNLLDVTGTADGGFVLVGDFSQGVIDLGPVGVLSNPDVDLDAFVVKLSSSLAVEAGRRYGDAAANVAQSALYATSSGPYVYVGGISAGPFSAGGIGNFCPAAGCAWMMRFNEDLVEIWAAAAFGNAVLSDLSSNGEAVTALLKLNGDVELRSGIGGSIPVSLSAGERLLWRLDSTGNPLWDVQFELGASFFEFPGFSVVHITDSSSGPLVLGTFSGTTEILGETLLTDGSNDIAFIKLGLSGELEYVKHYPGLGDQRALLLASEVQDARLWGLLFNSGTVNLDVAELVDSGNVGSLVVTQLVP
jgi:hypothetical protein